MPIPPPLPTDDVRVWRDALIAYQANVDPRLKGWRRLLRLEEAETDGPPDPIVSVAIKSFLDRQSVTQRLIEDLTSLINLGGLTLPVFPMPGAVYQDLIENKEEIALALESAQADLTTGGTLTFETEPLETP